MTKLLLIVLLGLTTISCSKANFETEGFDEFASSVDCHDAECSSYTVRDNAKNPTLYNKTDILFVFDTSGSMIDENLKLAERMSGFIEDLEFKNIDYNICHTFADKDYFKSGVVKPWSNGEVVLNSKTHRPDNVFYNTVNNIKNVKGSGLEEPIAATYYMIKSQQNSDCFRENVPLEVVILSDEDELSCADHCDSLTKFNNILFGVKLRTANYPQQLVNLANSVFPSKAFTVNSIVKQSAVSQCYVDKENEGRFHAQLADLTGGYLGDICADNYAEQLGAISKSISKTLDSVALRCKPTSDIKIKASNGMTFRQEIVKNRLQLTPGIPSGVDVELTYDCKL